MYAIRSYYGKLNDVYDIQRGGNMDNLKCEICSVNERVKFYDCDYKHRMKLSTILKHSAELAGYDYTIKGFSHEFLWEKQMVFLLSRISMKIFNYPKDTDELTISTWECGKKGAVFMRGTSYNFV